MAPNCLTARWLRPIVVLFALAAIALMGGCGGGSGAPNNPYAPPPVTPGPMAILPTTSQVYSNTPATLQISGGVPPYQVFSSNATVLPVAQASTTGTVVLLPANVAADTAVTITAQDSTGATAVAGVTVKAAPIFNTLTVTPASTACGTNSMCSGQSGTATVKVTGPGGVGLANHQVRFDVVTGAFGIKSTDPANPFVSTLTVVSDQFGMAQVVLQAAAGVATQPAQLRATELSSGEQQTAQFTIVQTTNGSAVLSVIPPSVTFTGLDNTQCTNNFRADYYIFGGTPPYQVSATPNVPVAVLLANVPVTTAGGFFTAITNGTCTGQGGVTLLIVDASGLETTATLNNVLGTSAPPAPPPPSALILAPTIYNVTGCVAGTTQFTFIVAGGSPSYNASSTVGTPNPQSINQSGGTFTVTWAGPAVGNASVLVVDSGSPQQTVTGQIFCNP